MTQKLWWLGLRFILVRGEKWVFWVYSEDAEGL